MRFPLFSIVTINYNDKFGLEKTIKSVLSQSFCDFEYIIIDGGSKDGSREVIESFINKPNFNKKITYWCSEPDKGIYNAMNKGIAHANGKFVVLLNSGDWFTENILNDISLIAKNNLHKVLYGAVNFYQDGKFLNVYGSSSELLPKQMIAHPSCFVPLEIYKKFGEYDESFKIAGDYDYFLKLYSNKVSFLWTNKLITNFNLSGISNKNLELVEKENTLIQKKYGFYQNPTFISKLKKIAKKILKC